MAHRQTRWLAGLGGLVFAALANAGDVNGKVPLDIPQQSLASALTTLAKQADLQILFSQELVAGIQSIALSGSYSGAEALQRLLAQSNLEYVVSGPDTIVIRPRPVAVVPVSRANDSPDTAATPAASPQEEGAPLAEIIVSAQKRLQRLQDVPVAVTALSGETLTQSNVNDTAGLVTMTPSLTYTQGAQPSNTNFRIRGIGTALFGQGLEPSVSVVVDGIVLARSSQGFADLADIERVEVLRGPQGTLFGKNAVGGLINVVTRRPSDTFQADLDMTVAEQEEYRVRGTISGPLNETMGARLTGYYNDVGGHIHNVTLDKDVNSSRSLGFRGKFEWDATERLNLLLTADYRESDTDCCSSQYISVTNPLLAQLLLPVVASFNNTQETENLRTFFTTDQKTASLEANLDLEPFTITSLTAYQDFAILNNQPIDRLNTPAPLYLPATNGQFDINGGTVDIAQFSQELRLTSPSSDAFNYVAGLYFLDFELDRGFQRRTGNCAPGGNAAAFGQPCVVPLFRSQAGFHANTTTKNIAAFGQTDFRIVGNLSGIAGARLQYEEIAYDGVRSDTRLVAGDLPLQGMSPSAGSGKSDDTVVTGKLGLQYKFSDDAQTYLTWSTGYKGAGYEVEFAADFANQQPVEPETAKAWELGYKAQLFDGALSLNTALFHAKYEDLQVQANRGNADLGIVRFVTTNAGSSTTEGVELELTTRPLTGLLLSGGVTYVATSVDIDGLNCALSDQNAAPVITGQIPYNICYRSVAGANPVQNVRGGDLPNAPRWRGNLSARYEFALPGTSLESFVQLAASAQSKMNFVIEQDPLTS